MFSFHGHYSWCFMFSTFFVIWVNLVWLISFFSPYVASFNDFLFFPLLVQFFLWSCSTCLMSWSVHLLVSKLIANSIVYLFFFHLITIYILSCSQSQRSSCFYSRYNYFFFGAQHHAIHGSSLIDLSYFFPFFSLPILVVSRDVCSVIDYPLPYVTIV